MTVRVRKNMYRGVCHGALVLASVVAVISASQLSEGFGWSAIGLIIWAISPYILFGTFALMMDFLLPGSVTMFSLMISALILTGVGLVMLITQVGFVSNPESISNLRQLAGWQLVGGFVLAGVCSGIIIINQMREEG